LRIFDNIAASEDTHTAAVKTLLDRYSLPDPVADMAAGQFQDLDMQMLYDSLTARGTPSSLDALYVGAAIEELDIVDLLRLENQLVDNDDIALVYANLRKGSRNHLRAFYREIVNNSGTYTPEYLDQSDFDAIVNSDMETGN
jgi:hypothetical protein